MASSPSSALWHKDTIYADLAMKAGRVQEALGHYARSLIAAEGRGDDLQVLFDLQGLANALATLERDRDAVEVFGLAEGLTAQMSDVIPAPVEHLFGMAPLAAPGRLRRTRPHIWSWTTRQQGWSSTTSASIA